MRWRLRRPQRAALPAALPSSQTGRRGVFPLSVAPCRAGGKRRGADLGGRRHHAGPARPPPKTGRTTVRVLDGGGARRRPQGPCRHGCLTQRGELQGGADRPAKQLAPRACAALVRGFGGEHVFARLRGWADGIPPAATAESLRNRGFRSAARNRDHPPATGIARPPGTRPSGLSREAERAAWGARAGAGEVGEWARERAPGRASRRGAQGPVSARSCPPRGARARPRSGGSGSRCAWPPRSTPRTRAGARTTAPRSARARRRAPPRGPR